jgi:protein SCO1
VVEQSEPSPRRTGPFALGRREMLGFAVMLVALGGVLALVLRHQSAAKAPGGATAAQSSRFAGLAVSPATPAPPLVLKNYLGNTVNLADYRGKAVLVTFLYTHCPDVCPLITSMLHTALTRMSPSERRRTQIIAVSVDPRGDTARSVASFLAAHEMTGRMQYLIGSAGALGAVWSRWGIASKRDAGSPELVEHEALIYGITAAGKIATVYPANFTPREIVHDVPVLAPA